MDYKCLIQGKQLENYKIYWFNAFIGLYNVSFKESNWKITKSTGSMPSFFVMNQVHFGSHRRLRPKHMHKREGYQWY